MPSTFFVVLTLSASVVKFVDAQDCLCSQHGKNSRCVDGEIDVCECKQGFEPEDDLNYYCKDINECALSMDDCVQKCDNYDGGFRCSCGLNFQGDGKKSGNGCADKDECEESSRCGDGGTCVNIIANKTSDEGYRCECFPGFRIFLDIACSEQTCKFEPPNLPQHAQSGSCLKFYNKNGDSKIHLSTYTDPTCHIGCRAGYKRIGGTFTCGPNNPNGERTENPIGVIASTPLECVEQKCDIITSANLANFGKHAVIGSCGGHLDALAGKRTCELECMDGFVKTSGGVISCGPNGDEAWGTLSGSITCEGIPCDPLVVPNSDHKDGHNKNSKTSDEVSVTCDDGYANKNNGKSGSTATCVSDGNGKSKWDDLPDCQRASCGPLKVLGSTHSDGNHAGVTGDTVIVGCAHGYSGSSTTVTCKAVAPGVSRWVGMPTCAAATCPSLSVAHGKVSSTSPSKTMDTVDITCDDGYKKFGTRAVCSPDGPGQAVWKSIPICAAVLCPLKKIPNSDRADGIIAKVNEKVSVKCDGATDPFAIVCIAIRPGVAMWHGSASCPAVTCPPLDVDNGKASSTSPSKVTETVDIACDNGYKKVGTKATCSPTGPGKAAWTDIPTCEAVSCPPKKIPNSDKDDVIIGKVGERVAVKCNGATHAFTVTCTAVGPETAFWSGFVSCPETPADRCPALVVDHGKASSTSFAKESETVDIICDNGYNKTGTSAVCSSTGSGGVAWTSVPACEATSCPVTKIPNSDKEDGITGKVGESVSVTCNGRASFAVRCLGVGPGEAIWTGFEPCPDAPSDMCAPLIVDHGKASSTAYTKILGSVDVVCDEGYEIVGDKSALCVPGTSEEAEWDAVPKCAGAPCPLKKIPYSNKADGITGRVGESVFVKCNDRNRDPFFVECAAAGENKPTWAPFEPCPEKEENIQVGGSGADAAIVTLSTYLCAMLPSLFV